MKYIAKTFLNGLLTIIPLIITLYIIFWLVQFFESSFGKIIGLIIPHKYYVPGMGILMGIGLIFLAGLLVQTWGLRTLYRAGEILLEKFPFVGDIYKTLKEFMEYLLVSKKDTLEQVVMVKFNDSRFLGIVTRENFKDAPVGIADEGMVAVYVPMSYQIGGFTIYTSKNNLIPIKMNKKEAMQWSLTAGITKKVQTLKN